MNKKIIAGVASVVFLSVAVLVVNATDAPNINICVNTNSGEVKVIGNSASDKEACENKPNHTVLTINPNGGEQGAQGGIGNPGSAATVTASTTTTGAPGSSAFVTNSGSTTAAVFHFTIPRGDVGVPGAPGEQGPNSLSGLTTIASTTTQLNTKTLTATCPSSNPIVIGGGFKGTNSTVQESYPNGSSWTVQLSGNKNDWTVYAICSK